MPPHETLVEQDTKRRALSLERSAEKLKEAKRAYEQAQRMHARRLAHDETLSDNDDEQAAERAFDKLKRRYRSQVRKTLTGHREHRPLESQPSIYRVWDSLYDDWLSKKKALTGARVDYIRLTQKTGIQERQLRTLVQRLLHVHLIPVAGGRGRGNSLMVVPAHYPWRLGEDSEPEFTENLARPALTKPPRRS